MAPGRHMRQVDQRPVGRSCQGEIGYWSPVCPRTQEGTHLLPEETRQVGWVRFQFDSVYFSPMVVIVRGLGLDSKRGQRNEQSKICLQLKMLDWLTIFWKDLQQIAVWI